MFQPNQRIGMPLLDDQKYYDDIRKFSKSQYEDMYGRLKSARRWYVVGLCSLVGGLLFFEVPSVVALCATLVACTLAIIECLLRGFLGLLTQNALSIYGVELIADIHLRDRVPDTPVEKASEGGIFDVFPIKPEH